jgi:membrane-associated phospholipid phosphatase
VSAVLVCLVVLEIPVAAQDAPVREFLEDAGRIWTAPFRIRQRDVAPLLVLTAATAFLIAGDEGIRDGVQDFVARNTWVSGTADAVDEMGNLGAWATAGAFFGAGIIFKDLKAKETGYLAASAMLQTFLVDNFFKGLTGRQRPFFADGEDHWSGPVGFWKRFDKDEEARYVSFPSGHTANAFALATVVAMQYRDEPWVPVLAYTVAASVGLSRMALDRHWASDVLVGAVVGHFVSRLVVRNHRRRQRLVPALSCSGRAVVLSLSYDLGPGFR